MTLPNSDNLKARVAKVSPEKSSRLEILRTCLKLAYKRVAKSNKKAQQKILARLNYELLK
jgi:hypothetical protein